MSQRSRGPKPPKPPKPANNNESERLDQVMNIMEAELGEGRRRLIIDGKRHDVRMEERIWQAMDAVSRRERRTIHELADAVARNRAPGVSIASALRCFVLDEAAGRPTVLDDLFD